MFGVHRRGELTSRAECALLIDEPLMPYLAGAFNLCVKYLFAAVAAAPEGTMQSEFGASIRQQAVENTGI
jgi:hypothetical protein